MATDLVRGAIAGAVATWAVDRTADVIEGRGELASAIRRFALGEGAAAKTASGQVVDSGDEGADAHAGAVTRRDSGPLRWGLGVGAGAVYGVIRPRVPLLNRRQRMGFGSSFFVLIDEGLVSALGFRAPPSAFPWNADTRGLAGHIVFGVVADATLSVLDRIT
jgi:hypothetical protein